LPGPGPKTARRYGLSQAPVREALGQLAAEGLVVMHANRGAQVRPVDATFVRELYEIRIALEPVLAGKSAAVARPRDVADLERIEREFEGAVERGDRATTIRANARLHHRIYEIRPNAEAIRLLRHHSALMSTIRHRFGFAQARFPQIVDEHHRLIDAVRRNDGRAALRVMRRHIAHSIEDIMARIAAADAGA
jgi:DNA-binding GntR family transcriptional regulator